MIVYDTSGQIFHPKQTRSVEWKKHAATIKPYGGGDSLLDIIDRDEADRMRLMEDFYFIVSIAR